MTGLSGYFNNPEDDVLDPAAGAEEEQRRRLLAAGPPPGPDAAPRPWYKPPTEIPGPRPIEDSVAPEPIPDAPDAPADLPDVAAPPALIKPPSVAPVDTNVQTALERRAQVFGNKPKDKEPKWWQRALAGAAGFGAGYYNAEGKAGHIDPRAAIDVALGGPGNRQRTADWQHQVQEAQLGVEGAQGEREAWFKRNKEEADQRLQDAQAEQARAHAGQMKATTEREQNQWKIDPKSGRMYNTITGETKEPASTLSGRIAEAKAAGLSPEEAKIYATGGKLGEPKQDSWQTKTETDAKGNVWEWRVNPHTNESTKPVNKGPLGKPVQPSLSSFSQSPEGQSMIDDIAKDLAAGNLTRIKDIASLRGDQRMQIFARARKYNPQFSTAEIDRQIKMEDYVTNGKGADQLQSFGTFLEHAGDAADAMQHLSTIDARILNHSINWLRNNAASSPQYRAALTAIEPVKKEFETFLLNNRALYAEDRASADKILSEDLPLADSLKAMQTMGHVAVARFNEINARYRKVRNKDLDEPFSPEAIAGAQKIGIRLGALSPRTGTATPPSPAAAKTFPSAQVHAYAVAHGLDDAAARQAITGAGYTIQ